MPNKTIPTKVIFLLTATILVASIALPLALGRPIGLVYEKGQVMAFVSPILLLISSWFSWKIFIHRKELRLDSRPIWESPVLFWILLSAGFLILSLDELFSLHEQLGLFIAESMQKTGTPISEHFNELLPATYLLIGVLVLLFYGKELFQFPEIRPWLATGIVCFIGAVLLNLTAAKTSPMPLGRVLSDIVKLGGETCIATMLLTVWHNLITDPTVEAFLKTNVSKKIIGVEGDK
jgi:hypothetical protein